MPHPNTGRPISIRLQEKLRVSADANPFAACWEYTGTRTGPQGHGRISIDGHLEMAHRVAYRLWVGPIPEGMKICHRCDNPICCNPTHLFLGTQRDNMRDAAAKGRTGPQIRDWSKCKNGHDLSGENVYIHPSTGRRNCRTCRVAKAAEWHAANPERTQEQNRKAALKRRHRVAQLQQDAADKMQAVLG